MVERLFYKQPNEAKNDYSYYNKLLKERFDKPLMFGQLDLHLLGFCISSRWCFPLLSLLLGHRRHLRKECFHSSQKTTLSSGHKSHTKWAA